MGSCSYLSLLTLVCSPVVPCLLHAMLEQGASAGARKLPQRTEDLPSSVNNLRVD